MSWPKKGQEVRCSCRCTCHPGLCNRPGRSYRCSDCRQAGCATRADLKAARESGGTIE